MKDCIFCQIVSGEKSSHKLYEDKKTLAFLTIGPVNQGHALVVPKSHHETCHETPDAELGAMMGTVKKVAEAAMKATGAKGYNVNINCGKVAHQLVMHTHIHVIPRFEGDGLLPWPHRDMTTAEMDAVAAKIVAAMK